MRWRGGTPCRRLPSRKIRLLGVQTGPFEGIPGLAGDMPPSLPGRVSLGPEAEAITSGRPTNPDRTPVIQAGFSEEAASLASQGRRPSTLGLYDKRLRLFGEWCMDRKITPSNASLGEVADFLVYIFGSDAIGIRNLCCPVGVGVYVCMCVCVCVWRVCVCVCMCVTPLVTTITQEPYIVQMS